MTVAAPEISICLATFNDGRWIDACMDSALAQDHARFEVVVVDDASSDDTAQRLDRYAGDERTTIVRNPRNVGEARTMNRAIGLARGRYVKLLHGDDELLPGCLEAMGALAARSGAAMVFARREIVLEEPGDPAAQAWARRYRAPHEYFGELAEVTPGIALFHRQLAGGLLVNRFAEPSGVLLDRRVLERHGGFHLRMVGHLDIDLWLRALLAGPVGFVDAPLYRYRRRAGSASSRRVPRQLGFLDALWSLEGLRQQGFFEQVPGLRRRYAGECKRCLLAAPGAVKLGPAGWKASRMASFAAYALADSVRSAPPLHGAIAPG